MDEAQAIQRIRAEYIEMPGLSLRPEQVQRLCGVDRALCVNVLDALVESGFLSLRPDGAYGRFRNPYIARTRPAKVVFDSALAARSLPRAQAG